MYSSESPDVLNVKEVNFIFSLKSFIEFDKSVRITGLQKTLATAESIII